MSVLFFFTCSLFLCCPLFEVAVLTSHVGFLFFPKGIKTLLFLFFLINFFLPSTLWSGGSNLSCWFSFLIPMGIKTLFFLFSPKWSVFTTGSLFFFCRLFEGVVATSHVIFYSQWNKNSFFLFSLLNFV